MLGILVYTRDWGRAPVLIVGAGMGRGVGCYWHLVVAGQGCC